VESGKNLPPSPFIVKKGRERAARQKAECSVPRSRRKEKRGASIHKIASRENSGTFLAILLKTKLKEEGEGELP